MQINEFIRKLTGRYLWGHIAAMAVVTVLLAVGVKFGIDAYTHHGEVIVIPDLKRKNMADAEHILSNLGLNIEVEDTGYVKTLPPGCILEQSPAPGERVKTGRTIFVIINAKYTPTLTLPDLIDNSSLREAMAKLTAMGFKLGQPQFVDGEKDWVYGILVNGRHVTAGQRISVEDTVVILAGNGRISEEDSLSVIDPSAHTPALEGEEESVDEFEEVGPPPAENAPDEGNIHP